MKINKDCLNDSLIQLYIDKELSEEERNQVEGHLEQCPCCSVKIKNHSDWIEQFKSAFGKNSGSDTQIPEMQLTITRRKKHVLKIFIRIAAVFILVFGGYFLFQEISPKKYKPTAVDLLIWEEINSGNDANYSWHNRSISILVTDDEGRINYMNIN